MASNKHSVEPMKQVTADAVRGQEENDHNSNLSPSKSADPARKKTFRIISVKKGGTGSGDVTADNDADSIDGLDESQTEDLSSEFYDSSKATDLDMDIQDSINLPLTPDEVTSTTTIVVKQKPDRDSQSRFKVVKIETKEPFRRGKWVCYDFFDTAPAAVVTLEKNGSKMTEDSIIHSALSGNLSSSSSVHYVQDVNDSSSNIFVTPVVPLSPTKLDGQPILSDVFVPIQPPQTGQVLNQLDGLSSDVMAPFIAQQVLMSVAGVPTSSTSFHNLAHPGHTTIVQSLPHTNIFPYAQNGPPSSLFANGIDAGQTSQVVNLSTDAILPATGSGVPTMVTTPTSAGDENSGHNQAFVIVDGVTVPHSQAQTVVGGITPQGSSSVVDASQTATAGSGIPASVGQINQSRTDEVVAKSNEELGEQIGPGMDDSTGSVKTLQGEVDGQTPQGLEEVVETMYIGLEGHEDDVDESGGSTVAIDNKIEQAMDLVKRHLMYAVREEVEILKQQIGEMMERIGQLEYENTLLRSEAKPETLNKLLIPRVVQQPQATLPGPTPAVMGAPAIQQPQQTTTPQSVSLSQVQLQPSQQASQQTSQPQQQGQQTQSSQISQPPST